MITKIKGDLSKINYEYFEKLSIDQRQRFIYTSQHLDDFLFTPERTELLHSIIMELNDIYMNSTCINFKTNITNLIVDVNIILREAME